MARIEKYPKDQVITFNDMVIGTDGDNLNKTRNFPIWQLSQIILGQLKHSGLILQYANGMDPEVQLGAEGYFFTNDNLISKDQTTYFYFSQTTLFGENLSALLNSVGSNLGDLYVSLTQQDDAANYGFFDILTVERIDSYYKVGVKVKGSLFAKTFQDRKNYALMFDLATNEYSIDAVGSTVNIYKNGVLVDSATITVNPDEVNLARLVSGVVADNGIATFIRDDETTFTVDFSGFLGSAIPKRTSDLINDGDGTGAPFVTDAYSKQEVDNKDAFIQEQVSINTQDISILKGLDIRYNEATRKVQLYDGSNSLLAEADVKLLDNEGVRVEYDPTGKTLNLYNIDGDLLDSVPIVSFVSGLASKIQFNAIDQNKLEIVNGNGEVISFVNITTHNVEGLVELLGESAKTKVRVIQVLKNDLISYDRQGLAEYLNRTGFTKYPNETLMFSVVDSLEVVITILYPAENEILLTDTLEFSFEINTHQAVLETVRSLNDTVTTSFYLK